MLSVTAGHCRAEGMIKNVNTIEEYRSLDNGAILSQAARTVRSHPTSLSKVIGLANHLL